MEQLEVQRVHVFRTKEGKHVPPSPSEPGRGCFKKERRQREERKYPFWLR